MNRETSDSSWWPIRVYLSPREAEGDKRFLKHNGIEAIVRPVTTLPPGPGPRGVELVVPAEHHPQARQLIPLEFDLEDRTPRHSDEA